MTIAIATVFKWSEIQEIQLEIRYYFKNLPINKKGEL